MWDKLITMKQEKIDRIIAISDIHGYIEYLDELLKKLNLKENDFLIILGDFINRGTDSIQTLERIQQLAQRDNTIILSGNHEQSLVEYLLDDNLNDELLRLLKSSNRAGLLKEWVSKYKINIKEMTKGKELKKELLKNIKEEINFLSNLKYGLEINDLIFVHSGIGEMSDWTKSSIDQLLRTQEFYKKINNSGKTVIAGHWPTQNMRPLSLNNDIIYFKEKNIVCIDGGTMKANKQLNALIITTMNNEYSFSQMSYDPYPSIKLSKDCTSFDKRIVKFDFMSTRLKLIERGIELSLCKNLDSNLIGYVFNAFIIQNEGEYIFSTHKTDYVSRFFDLKKGEIVKFILIQDSFVLVKYENEFGWIRKDCLNLTNEHNDLNKG